ncbi:guanine nucleotide exchange factor [Anaeramoeba flamelloides]|uniref:Guanine nucleotide exchange factor n=1 Tax=Anaeramoeba flamelloides TaxID=1746091 RepID=A0AAV7ZTC1_9EUKA|nr:guanine nucleotide exchange factor [Anaeramoeba flamelloides]
MSQTAEQEMEMEIEREKENENKKEKGKENENENENEKEIIKENQNENENEQTQIQTQIQTETETKTEEQYDVLSILFVNKPETVSKRRIQPIKLTSNENENENEIVLDNEYKNENVATYQLEEGLYFPTKGTLKSMVQYLTNGGFANQDSIEQFLKIYQNFCTPELLFEEVIERFNSGNQKTNKINEILKRDQLRMTNEQVRCLEFILVWCHLQKEDFQSNLEFTKSVNEFFTKIVSQVSKRLAYQIKGELNLLLSSPGKSYLTRAHSSGKSHFESILPNNLNKFKFLDLSPEELARQLTLIDHQLLQKIESREYVGFVWNDLKVLKERSPNLLNFLQRWKLLNRWVIMTILSPSKSMQRAQIIEHWLLIAKFFCEINNFSGIFCIIYALQNESIVRLDITWKEVPISAKRILDKLLNLVSKINNYRKYRLTLKSTKSPALPFLHLYLYDMSVICHNMKDLNSEKVEINYEHYWEISKIILKIQLLQRSKFPFTKISEIKNYLLTINPPPYETLLDRSRKKVEKKSTYKSVSLLFEQTSLQNYRNKKLNENQNSSNTINNNSIGNTNESGEGNVGANFNEKNNEQETGTGTGMGAETGTGTGIGTRTETGTETEMKTEIGKEIGIEKEKEEKKEKENKKENEKEKEKGKRKGKGKGKGKGKEKKEESNDDEKYPEELCCWTNSLLDPIYESKILYHDEIEEQENFVNDFNELNMEDCILEIEESMENGILKKSETVIAATVEWLVDYLCSPTANSDSGFVQTFLLTYRSFTTATELLILLKKKFLLKPPTELSGRNLNLYNEKILKPMKFKVFSVLNQWVRFHFYDFKFDPTLIEQFKHFIENVMLPQEEMSKPGKMLKAIFTKMEKQDLTISRNSLHTGLEMPKPIVPKDLNNFTFMELDRIEFARQITLIEFNLFRKIKPKECLKQGWTKKDKQKRAPNIVNLTNYFNNMSGWIANEIISHPKLRARTQLITKFIKIALQCKEFSNFNAVQEIIAGLNNAAIFRLKKSWKEISNSLKEKWQKLIALMSRENSYCLIRDELSSIDPPGLPYIGMYLTDLVFVDEGNTDLLSSTDGRKKLINFDKRRRTSEVIREIQLFQQAPYLFTLIPEIQSFIEKNTAMSYDDEKLYEQSLKVEPRDRK